MSEFGGLHDKSRIGIDRSSLQREVRKADGMEPLCPAVSICIVEQRVVTQVGR